MGRAAGGRQPLLVKVLLRHGNHAAGQSSDELRIIQRNAGHHAAIVALGGTPPTSRNAPATETSAIDKLAFVADADSNGCSQSVLTPALKKEVAESISDDEYEPFF